MYDNRQHKLILNTPIALFLGALALKMELVKFIFFVGFFFVSYLIMLPSGPSDSAFTHRGPKTRVVMGGWMGGDFVPPWIFFIFKYDNKQLKFISKKCLKIASAY